jgi:hypothetical protein
MSEKRDIQKEILIQYSEYRRLIESEKKLHELMQKRSAAPSQSNVEGEAKHLEGDGVAAVPGASSQQPVPIVLDTRPPPAIPVYQEKGLDDLQDVVDQGQRQLSHQADHHHQVQPSTHKEKKLKKKKEEKKDDTDSESEKSEPEKKSPALVPWYYLGPGPFQDSD